MCNWAGGPLPAAGLARTAGSSAAQQDEKGETAARRPLLHPGAGHPGLGRSFLVFVGTSWVLVSEPGFF